MTFTIGVTGTAATEAFQSIVVDFGDGTSSDVLSGGGQSVSHIYNASGTYTVTATGTAASGNSKRATTIIAVTERGLVNVTIQNLRLAPWPGTRS